METFIEINTNMTVLKWKMKMERQIFPFISYINKKNLIQREFHFNSLPNESRYFHMCACFILITKFVRLFSSN